MFSYSTLIGMPSLVMTGIVRGAAMKVNTMMMPTVVVTIRSRLPLMSGKLVAAAKATAPLRPANHSTNWLFLLIGFKLLRYKA